MPPKNFLKHDRGFIGPLRGNTAITTITTAIAIAKRDPAAPFITVIYAFFRDDI